MTWCRQCGKLSSKPVRIIHCAECGRNTWNHGRDLCKGCYRRGWRAKNPEKVRADYIKHKERESERHKKYYKDHREELLAKNQKWHKNNRDKANARGRRWYKDNRVKRIERTARRRAWKYNAAIEPLADFVAQLIQEGNMCTYCGSTNKPLESDHIVPLSRGGSHTEDNLVAACRSCNSSKHARALEEWLQDQPYSIVWVL